MTCNIDARGRWARGVLGILSLLSGMAPWILSDHPGREISAMGAALVVLGFFFLFEAWRGWCLLRALGFKTPI